MLPHCLRVTYGMFVGANTSRNGTRHRAIRVFGIDKAISLSLSIYIYIYIYICIHIHTYTYIISCYSIWYYIYYVIPSTYVIDYNRLPIREHHATEPPRLRAHAAEGPQRRCRSGGDCGHRRSGSDPLLLRRALQTFSVTELPPLPPGVPFFRRLPPEWSVVRSPSTTSTTWSSPSAATSPSLSCWPPAATLRTPTPASTACSGGRHLA